MCQYTPSGCRSEKSGNRYDWREFAGAFGEVGTLIPFVAAYISLLKMDPAGILLAFGGALIAAGLFYKTPFPVQPMKAIGAAAITQGLGAVTLTPAMVVGAGMATGLIWIGLGATGLAQRLAIWIPRTALLGVVMGLGFSFMLEGLQLMAKSWVIAVSLLVMTLLLLARSRFPAMVVLLLAGAAVALVQQNSLLNELALIKPVPRLPTLTWSSLGWNDIWRGAFLLALPQLPLTFGNALMAITEENNRLFPDRQVTERKVAFSTGLLNLFSSAVGGIPMCHGAGGMAGHVKFGACTGGASVMLGMLLTVLALFFADSVAVMFRLFPPATLGVILFLAGAELALSSRDSETYKEDRFVVVTTAAFAIVNVGMAVVFGFFAHHASKRGWLKI